MSRSVAVLGAGIMGSSAALHLARRGKAVTLFDEAPEPFSGASRWNEGKIHLGFLYAADPTLRTAQAVVTGGLDFKGQVEQLTDLSLDAVMTQQDDHYLVHRDSVVPPESVERYLDSVAAMVVACPGADRYLVDVSSCSVERLTPNELAAICDSSLVVAGYRVPERSVDTQIVADAFVAALRATASIETAWSRRVTGVTPESGASGRWFVHTTDTRHGPFDAVVNALWHGRPAIDASVGHRTDIDPQHRYRVSVFAHTRYVVDAPCAVLNVGPFGDVKSYDGQRFYLSWYPLGLLARAESVVPPTVPERDGAAATELADAVFAALAEHLPWVERIRSAADQMRVEGGWVYSQGRGVLDDPRAGVHQRNRLGITNAGTYYSVDTGKYSVAPTLADRLARML